MSLQRLRIILHGTLEGKSVILNEREFVDGIFEVIGSSDDCAGIAKYHSASYNCETWIGEATELPPTTEKENNVALLTTWKADADARGYDRSMYTDEDIQEAIIKSSEPEFLECLRKAKEARVAPTTEAEPSAREQDIIAAINLVEGKWVQDVVPHPSVIAVAELLGESNIRKEEIVAMVEKFHLVDDSPEEVQEAPAPDLTAEPVELAASVDKNKE